MEWQALGLSLAVATRSVLFSLPLAIAVAWVLAAMGEYGPALELYEKVRSPTHYRVYLAVGDIYLNLDQPDKALEQFQYVHRKVSKPLDQAMLAEASDRMAVA